MMLLNSFYEILRSSQDVYAIRFNASHPVFSGHFPGHAVVPGACLVQIAEELAALACGHPVRFAAVRDLKFRQPVTPGREINVSIRKTAESMCGVRFLIQANDSVKETELVASFNARFISV